MNYEIKGYEDKEVRKGDVWKDGYGKQWEIIDFNADCEEEDITYCLTVRDAVKVRENFTIKGYLLAHFPKSPDNLLTYVGNITEVPCEDDHAQCTPYEPEPEPEPEPEHVFSQGISEPYDYETGEDSIVDNTIHVQPMINHNGEYYIKQAIHIYVASDDLDRARILIKALKHIKEI